MINGRQIRAARGLLKWSAVTLAEKASLTRETINKIEDETVQPREGTLADIKRAFDENGVEFLDSSGVRLKPQGVEILLGSDGLRDFFDGVYDYVQRHGGNILQMGVDDALYATHLGEHSTVHVDRMTRIVKERGIKVLKIVGEGHTDQLVPFAEYRWLPKEIFEPIPFYVYGDCLGIVSFQTIPGPTVVLNKIAAITNAYRKQFEVMWKVAKPLETLLGKK